MMNLAEYRRNSSHLADFLPWAALERQGMRQVREAGREAEERGKGARVTYRYKITVPDSLRQPFLTSAGGLRGVQDFTASAMALICSGVVPQHPPTMLTRLSSAKLYNRKKRLSTIT